MANSFRILKDAYLGLFFIFYALWGVSWSVPYLDVGYTSLWYLLLLTAVFFFGAKSFNIGFVRIYLLVLLLVTTYSFFGLFGVFETTGNPTDVQYILEYELRFLLNFLAILFIIGMIKSLDNFRLVFVCLSISIVAIYSIMHWRYFYDLNASYLGVVVDELAPSRSGKNSFATSIALVFPLLLGSLFYIKGSFYRLIILLGLTAVLLTVVNIQSRSMFLILGMEFLIFYVYFKELRSLKMHVSYSLIALLIMAFTTNISIKDFVYKKNQYSDHSTGFSNYAQYDIDGPVGKYLNSHRGWLLTEAVSGYVDSALLGHGIGTYRIRPTNKGSRTDTHNDYALLLYETGTVGLLLFLYIFYDRVRQTNRIINHKRNPILVGSLSSIFGLMIAMLFINIIHTLIFWTIIALNLALINLFKRV